MNENSVLIALIEELKHRIEIADRIESLESRLRFLEERVQALENGGEPLCGLKKANDYANLSNIVEETEEINADAPKVEKPAGNVLYFESLLRDEDGAYYVEPDKLHTSPDNYSLVINGEQADAFITSDTEKIKSMMKEFKKYLFPLKRPAMDPPQDCAVETAEPGQFVLKDNKWYMQKKITIKYI